MSLYELLNELTIMRDKNLEILGQQMALINKVSAIIAAVESQENKVEETANQAE